jgi:alpha-L-fucosidase
MKFTNTLDSLATNYKAPEWFRDAKFGIWAHWGPQAVTEAGDWYARNMYVQGTSQYVHHCRTYGHPSKFGYKDLLKLWTAEALDPKGLVDFYKSCGAKYFVAQANHHDNVDCWNSKHHKWNSVNLGPKRDIVGEFAKAARDAGLRFGVTEHLERTYSWFNTNKGCDTYGPHKGVPYDGNDPEYQDLYVPPHDDTSLAYPKNPSEAWQQEWLARITDLIEQHDPDLLYSDGGVPFGRVGCEMIARYYNRNMERRDGRLEAVYALKDMEDHGDYREGVGVLDMERGVVEGIHPNPWQTDTCVGGWFYDTRIPYKSPQKLIQMLVDIVSKNGNLLLNFPLRGDGSLDEGCHWLATEIGTWLKTNGEAIYGTRPWNVYGEGAGQLPAGHYAENKQVKFTHEDIRFTRKGDAAYAMLMGDPRAEGKIKIGSINHAESATWLANGKTVEVNKEDGVLVIEVPNDLSGDYVWTLRLDGAK